jgi:hypothetical protein
MRKIIGSIFFVISSLIIVAVVIADFAVFKDVFSGFGSEGILPTIALITATLWEFLYQPIVVLLLSVIAMGKYSK